MNTKTKIKDFIKNEVLSEANNDIQDNKMLLTDDVLDSLSIIKIITFIESEFNIDISSHDINIQDFETIDAMSEMVDSIISRGAKND